MCVLAELGVHTPVLDKLTRTGPRVTPDDSNSAGTMSWCSRMHHCNICMDIKCHVS